MFTHLLALAVLDHKPEKILVGGEDLLLLLHGLLQARPPLSDRAFLKVESSADRLPVHLQSLSVEVDAW